MNRPCFDLGSDPMIVRRLSLVKLFSSCRFCLVNDFPFVSLSLQPYESLSKPLLSTRDLSWPCLQPFDLFLRVFTSLCSSCCSLFLDLQILRVPCWVFESSYLHLSTRKHESRGKRRVFPRRALRCSTLVVLYCVLGERFVFVSMFSRERKSWCDFL